MRQRGRSTWRWGREGGGWSKDRDREMEREREGGREKALEGKLRSHPIIKLD